MTRGLKAIFAAAVGLLVVANGHASTASAQNASGNVVFHIGNFDRSSVEFAPGNPKQPVNFVAQRHPTLALPRAQSHFRSALSQRITVSIFHF
jgi:hypothetical protein